MRRKLPTQKQTTKNKTDRYENPSKRALRSVFDCIKPEIIKKNKKGYTKMNAEHCKAYTLLQEQQIDDIHAHGYLLRHNKSGARVLLLETEDDNKVFNIAFRTPPVNSTGVAHILEHSVLCGSREFPLKDPFVELVKGSLNTFLNAMTYPDKTMYPVASTNDADFQNLMHVYMDAVFYPNIYKHDEIFRQEGWSYHLESEDGTADLQRCCIQRDERSLLLRRRCPGA